MLLVDLAAALARVRIDLAQYAESYYFEEASPQASLALTIDHATELSAVALRSPHADVRLAGDPALARVTAPSADRSVVDRQQRRLGHGSSGSNACPSPTLSAGITLSVPSVSRTTRASRSKPPTPAPRTA